MWLKTIMNKYAYYPENENICHYIYVDDSGNASYEQYSIDNELMTESLDDLSQKDKQEWLMKAYDAEEQLVNEEKFLEKFTEYFDIYDKELEK